MAELSPRQRLLNLQNYVNEKIGQNLDLTEGIKVLAESSGGGSFDLDTSVNWVEVTNKPAIGVIDFSSFPDDWKFIKIKVTKSGNFNNEPFYIIPRPVYDVINNYASYLRLSYTNDWYIGVNNFAQTSLRYDGRSEISLYSIELGYCDETVTAEYMTSLRSNIVTYPSDISSYDYIFSICKNSYTGVTLCAINKGSYPLGVIQRSSNGETYSIVLKNGDNSMRPQLSVDGNSNFWGIKIE